MQTIVDPDEVRRFAGQLDQNAEAVRSGVRRADHSFHEMRAVWRDAKYAEFEAMFDEAKALLEDFVNRSECYAEHLRHRSRLLDSYHDNRY